MNRKDFPELQINVRDRFLNDASMVKKHDYQKQKQKQKKIFKRLKFFFSL